MIELRMNPEQITTRATIAALRAGKGAKSATKTKRAPAVKHPLLGSAWQVRAQAPLSPAPCCTG